METLKQLRKERGFSQEQLAGLIGVSRRTYQRYESSENEIEEEKLYQTICKILNLKVVDETHGILSIYEIGHKVRLICERYESVECVYLFGSYARGDMNESSDVDLLYIAPTIGGLEFGGLYDELNHKLRKNIDLISVDQISKDPILVSDIFKEGIKIYEKRKYKTQDRGCNI